MLETVLVMVIYGSLWAWFFGGFVSKKPDKPKSAEEQLGDALSKYLSSLDIPKKDTAKK